MFEQQLAQSAQSASDQRTNFEERLAQSARSLAQAVRNIRDMKEAYELGALLASEDAEVKRKISVGVRAFSVRNTHARQTRVLPVQLHSHFVSTNPVQNEVASSRQASLNEMSAQRQTHEKQIAKFVSDAAVCRANSDNQMARAGLEADFMQLAFDKLAGESVEQQRTSALVSMNSALWADAEADAICSILAVLWRYFWAPTVIHVPVS